MHRPTNTNKDLASFWGNKTFWHKEKDEAIAKARQFYRDNNLGFRELYWFVCELRYEIAKKQLVNSTEANTIDYFGTPRNENLNPLIQERYQTIWNATSTHNVFTTAISKTNKYQMYYEYLLKIFESENCNPVIISYADPARVNPIILSSIHLKEEYLIIEHTNKFMLDNVLDLCNLLYKNFIDETNPIVKLMALKILIWFSCQGCFCCRGSAAIQEIITEVLIAENKIDWHYSPRHIPIDLVAIFTSSPEKFIEEIDKIVMDPCKDKLIDEITFYGEDLQNRSNYDARFYDASVIEKLLAIRKLAKKIAGEKIIFTTEELKLLQDKNITEILDKYNAIQFIKNQSTTSKNSPPI